MRYQAKRIFLEKELTIYGKVSPSGAHVATQPADECTRDVARVGSDTGVLPILGGLTPATFIGASLLINLISL